jgi:hypothetical protein
MSSIATGYGLDDRGLCSSPSRVKKILHAVQTSYVAHPASLLISSEKYSATDTVM